MVPPVGIINSAATFVRELWSGPQAVSASAPAAPVIPSKAAPTKEEGVSGVPNFGGRITYEPIAELREQAGYGRSGDDWGFWEDLSAANSFVAAALDHVMGQVSDARIDVEDIPKELIGNGPGLVSAAIAKAMKELLEWNFTQALRLSAFNSLAVSGFLKSGFAIFEPLYAKDARGRWYCSKLPQRLPLSLHSNPWLENDEHTTLRAIRQQATRGYETVSPEIPIERLLLFIWQRQGNNWQGRSAFRAVQYIAGRVMPMLLKLIGVTLQREGAGIPIAQAKDPATPLEEPQRIALNELMQSMVFHESASAVLPAGWEINWVFSGGSNKGHVLEVWNSLGTVVLQQLGAQQLQLGTNGEGNRAVGQVHDARSTAKPKSALQQCEAVLNGDDNEPFQGLGPRICRFNFGEQAAYPRVKLTLQRPELPVSELTTSAAQAKAAGLFHPTFEDELVYRERAGLPPIDRAEWDKAKSEADARAATLPRAPGAPPPKPGEKQPEPKDKPLAKDERPVKASAQRTPFAPWRALRASEAKLPLAKHDEYFTSRRDVYETRAKPVIQSILAKAAAGISRAMADGKVQPAEIVALELKASKLFELNRQFVAEVRSAGAASVRDELAERPVMFAAADGDDREDDRTDTLRTIRENADEIADAQADALTRRQLGRLKGELEREAIDALRTKGTADEVIDRAIDRQLETGAFRSDAGYVTTKAFNVGRDEAARILGGIASVEYSAILDSATCSACTADDGKTAAFDSAEHDALLPPNRDCAGGDNCRCFLIMIPASAGEGADE